jgi:hypothetical protein
VGRGGGYPGAGTWRRISLVDNLRSPVEPENRTAWTAWRPEPHRSRSRNRAETTTPEGTGSLHGEHSIRERSEWWAAMLAPTAREEPN